MCVDLNYPTFRFFATQLERGHRRRARRRRHLPGARRRTTSAKPRSSGSSPRTAGSSATTSSSSRSGSARSPAGARSPSASASSPARSPRATGSTTSSSIPAVTTTERARDQSRARLQSGSCASRAVGRGPRVQTPRLAGHRRARQARRRSATHRTRCRADSLRECLSKAPPHLTSRCPTRTATTVTLSDLKGHDGRPVLLSQGRHARLHHAGVRDPRPPAGLHGRRCARAGRLARPGEGGQEVPRQAGAELHAARRRGPRGVRRVRRVGARSRCTARRTGAPCAPRSSSTATGRSRT